MRTVTPAELLGVMNPVESKYAPDILFAEGDLDLIREMPKVSIVGTRKPSDFGVSRARGLAQLLVGRGVMVVSGLAEGIDTAAHRAAIDAGGRTMAVLGTSIDRCYPKSNEGLLEEIKQRHIAVSQFPLGSAVRPGNFPRRNRTMALLSDATIIIEAGERSGTIHQGWEAIRLGRTLGILESVANRQDLTWPRAMLEYGAQVITRDNIHALIDELPSAAVAAAAEFAF